MSSRLSDKQEAFCQAYILRGDKTDKQVYESVYSSENMSDNATSVEVCRLLDNPKISLRIEELRKPIIKELVYTAKESFDNLEMIRPLALTPNGITGKLELAPAIKAEELKGKLGGLYVDQVKNTGEITTKTVFVTKEDKENADNHIESIIKGKK